jgi:hypothetical protein
MIFFKFINYFINNINYNKNNNNCNTNNTIFNINIFNYNKNNNIYNTNDNHVKKRNQIAYSLEEGKITELLLEDIYTSLYNTINKQVNRHVLNVL